MKYTGYNKGIYGLSYGEVESAECLKTPGGIVN